MVMFLIYSWVTGITLKTRLWTSFSQLWVSNYLFYRNKFEPSKKMSIINALVYVTYVFYYVILPDGGDAQASIRMFFGLIKDYRIISIAFLVSRLILAVNICLIVTQIIYAFKSKKR